MYCGMLFTLKFEISVKHFERLRSLPCIFMRCEIIENIQPKLKGSIKNKFANTLNFSFDVKILIPRTKFFFLKSSRGCSYLGFV